MIDEIRFTSVFSISLLLLTLVFSQEMNAQQFMSPFEADSNTVLLMHFDESLDNESTLGPADGQFYGESYGYVNSNVGDAFNRMLYLDNSSPTDTTGVIVPDHKELRLAEDWTIEIWVNILTFGETTDDWRWRPRIVVKTMQHEDGPAGYNYQLIGRGDFRSFRGNYRAFEDSTLLGWSWLNTDTSPGSFQTGEWFHMTYMRDASQNITGLLLHDKEGNLVEFASRDYNPDLFHPPDTFNTADINIGFMKYPDPPRLADAFVDGFLDELRISNTIRSYETAPIISNVTKLDQVAPNTQTEVAATVKFFEGSELDQLMLNYNAGNGWQSTQMAESQSQYVGNIPGQPAGTTVQYYVSGKAKNGLSSSAPNGVNPDRGPYMNYAVQDTAGMVLNLDFESGNLPPENNGNTGASLDWTLGGNPQVVDGGANGTSRALYLEGDSSHISLGTGLGEPNYQTDRNAAYMKSENFVIDFWVKSDSLPAGGTRFLIKEGQQRGIYEGWNAFNYQIWSPGAGNVVPASYFQNGSNVLTNEYSGNLTGLDSTITENKWYRIVNVMKSQDTVFSQLYNADNELIDEQGSALISESILSDPFPSGHPFLSNGPFRIGAFSPALEDLETPFGVPDGPLYNGWVDEVKFYNYVPDDYLITSIEEPGQIPERITLGDNYPNPFNPKTKINYSLPRAVDVTLTVYNVLGREVATLVDQKQKSGTYTVTFDGKGLASGLYFYHLKTDNVTKVKKMLLLK